MTTWRRRERTCSGRSSERESSSLRLTSLRRVRGSSPLSLALLTPLSLYSARLAAREDVEEQARLQAAAEKKRLTKLAKQSR